MRPTTPLPPGLRKRVFTFEQAMPAGVARSTLRSHTVEHLAPGVYCDVALADGTERRYWAAQLWAGKAVAYGTTALELRGYALPRFLAEDDVTHLGVPTTFPGRRPPPWVALHRVAPTPACSRLAGNPELWVSEPVAAWVQAAGQGLDTVRLTILGDRLVSRRRGICHLDDLAAAVDGAGRRRGISRLRAALARIRPGTDSPMESWLRLRIVDEGLPEPEVNREVLDENRHFIATVDLIYRRWRIAIFYDGDLHRTDQHQWRKDLDDQQDLTTAGWLVIRVTALVITDPYPTLQHIRHAILERSGTDPLPGTPLRPAQYWR